MRTQTFGSRMGQSALALLLLLCASGAAQQAPRTASPGGSSPAQLNPAPPMPTAPKPPVDLFRSVLVMSPIERKAFLEKRSPEAQKIILAKIKEYEGLTPEMRELRLRVTELRWYLEPLLSATPADRSQKLATVPKDIRELIEARLAQWDRLTPELQKQFLENEATIRFYFELTSRSGPHTAESVSNSPAMTTEGIQSGIRRWESLTAEQRNDVLSHFTQYFELTPEEKQKTLRSVSEPEREQIEKTLQTFSSLPQVQRVQCVRSFQRFANFTAEERQAFLHNAERWERMSPTDRQAWRNIVSRLANQPPLPPGLNFPPLPLRPVPTVLDPTRPAGSYATNSN